MTPFSTKASQSRSSSSKREQVALGQERHVFGHAIDTAEVAAVGHGDPEVSDGTPMAVDHAAVGTIQCGGTKQLIHRNLRGHKQDVARQKSRATRVLLRRHVVK